MYNRPADILSSDYLHPVSIETTDFWLETVRKPTNSSDSDVHQLAAIIMEEEGWIKTQDTETAIELYKNLRQKCLETLQVF